MKKNIFFFIFLFFSLLCMDNSAEHVFAEATPPPTGYPLGVATKTNLTAGETIYFNTDQLQDKQLVGQFLAKNITSKGSSGGAKGSFQNYEGKATIWPFEQIDPTIISESITGSDVIRWYANSTSFKYTDGEDLHFYIEHLPTEKELTSALQYYPGLRENFDKRIYRDSIETFPNFVDNNVANFSQVTGDIQNISDYYAGLTDTEETIVYNSAIQTAEVNTEKKVINPKDWGGQSSIQINIALKKGTSRQAVAIVNVDGQLEHFQKAQDISINYTNYDPDTMLPPYLIINYKHFPTFNFSGSTFFHAAAYPSLPNDDEYAFEGNKGVYFEGKYQDKAIPLIDSDNHVISESLKDRTYKMASHLIHNFNDEDKEIQFRSNASLFIGSVLAPRASVTLDDTQGKVLGSVISGYDIYTNMPISLEESEAMFDYSDFPGLGDIISGEELEAPVKVGNQFTYLGDEKQPLYTISQKVPAYSKRFPIKTFKITDQLADFLEITPEDILIRDESGIDVSNYFTVNQSVTNELSIEATSESLEDESFYGKTYRIELAGKLTLASPVDTDQLMIPNTAVTIANDQVKTSDEALLKVDFIQGAPVEIVYLNEDGQEIAPKEVLIGKIGLPYQTKAKMISGYTLSEKPAKEEGIFSEETQQLIYHYEGHLSFKAVPEQLNFGTHELSIKDQAYEIKSKDSDIVVKDTRLLGSSWQLRATLNTPLTGKNTRRILPEALGYVKDGQMIPLQTANSTIIQSTITTTHEDYNVSHQWETSHDGVKVIVKSGEALADQYSGEIRWELYDVVAND